MSRRKGHRAGRDKAGQPTSHTIYFYMPNEKPYGVFCQWHASSITLPLTTLGFLAASSTATPSPTAVLAQHPSSITFSCAEQLYMFCKALYFSDAAHCTRILATPDPKEQKKLGQTVKNFNDFKWSRVKFRVAVVGNWYKYTQNRGMRDRLLATGDKELAEASRRDRVWGIGFSEEEAEGHRDRWGESLLGKALMKVRGRIREWMRREEEGKKMDWEWDGGDEEENGTEEEGEKTELTVHADGDQVFGEGFTDSTGYDDGPKSG